MAGRGPAPPAWAAFWHSVVRFQTENVNPRLGLRNAIGMALPLAAGVALSYPGGGLVMSTGAVNVAFRDSDGPYGQRAREMFAASVLVGVAVFAGTVSGGHPIIAVMVAGTWAFVAGILVALSSPAADLGVMTLVMVLVYAAVPQAAGRAVLAGLLAFAGGLVQTAVTLAFWPLRKYDPERRALSDLYLELSRVAASPLRGAQSPPATAQSLEAQTALAALDRDHSVESARFRLLLSQAERMRLSLLMLVRLRIRIEREDPGASAISILERCFEVCAGMLSTLGNSLLAGTPAGAAAEGLQELQTLAERLREPAPEGSPAVRAMAGDARVQMDALAGQLRSAIDLAVSATAAGIADFERREATKPWTLRLRGTMAILRANLSLDSAACRHAVRLAVCVAGSDALARGFELRRSYWLPMTIAIVLKPDFTATFSRGVLRLAGTFAGLAFATALFHVLPAGSGWQVAAIAVLMFVLRCFGAANYGILVLAVTGLVVFMIAMTGVAPKEVIAARGVNTAIGGAIALLAYGLWPTWERTQVSEALARMLDAFRNYFQYVQQSYLKPELSFAHELDRTRVAARLARSNLEASIERASAEPGFTKDTMSSFSAMLASTHRLAHALLALEAGLSSSRPVPAREAFRTFANDVEVTLHTLAAVLRGSTLAPNSLPDLREDHHALIHSSDAAIDRYALVNVETDRITNSLNTLSEEVARWIGL